MGSNLVSTAALAPTESASTRWRPRPVLAWFMRLGVALVPLLGSVTVTTVATQLLPRPRTVVPLITWWLGLIVLAAVSFAAVTRWARRLLPISILLRLTLIFPDRAPSRRRVAMLAATQRSLERMVASAGDGRSAEPVRAAENVLALLALLNAHDRRTRGHSERVRAYSKLIADGMPSLTEEQRDRLQWAAMLHDVGKMEVAPAILNKQGKPTDAEWQELKQHPLAGYTYVAPLAGWLGDCIHAVDQHHERWDGTGYPHGLAGEEISLAGRIVAVADAFEVMTAARSYKRPMSADSARQELARCAGTHFDPEIVRVFLNISIGNLRSVMGPMSVLAELPVLARFQYIIQALWASSAPAARSLEAFLAAAAIATTLNTGLASNRPPGTDAVPVPAMADAPLLSPNSQSVSGVAAATMADIGTVSDPTASTTPINAETPSDGLAPTAEPGDTSTVVTVTPTVPTPTSGGVSALDSSLTTNPQITVPATTLPTVPLPAASVAVGPESASISVSAGPASAELIVALPTASNLEQPDTEVTIDAEVHGLTASTEVTVTLPIALDPEQPDTEATIDAQVGGLTSSAVVGLIAPLVGD